MKWNGMSDLVRYPSPLQGPQGLAWDGQSMWADERRERSFICARSEDVEHPARIRSAA